ncbi:hypothetical protein BEWA_008440 [Theileria equi strain WA]|uniref:Clp1 P-loop domain-containing protein n=1 Tax=Theileria equi strain WA TaxID=1537102 RepID=L0B2W0_THEEQ|nr:hypothetical protein BEWA_008440 [Theileria equi strain WA]AFZ81434.1 hypothetical protein BEWA_008440 [Theileria equi strain WA]|eukprot:XP_004831100.1 hypothetical protein BEWA_008440 [Theileria equi strain WA]
MLESSYFKGVPRDADSYLDIKLIGLNPGEYITLDKSVHFKVIRGIVSINGHLYKGSMSTYRKYIIPPWNPPERVLSLCTDGHSDSRCGCDDILWNNLFGGSCCSITAEYKGNRKAIREMLEITEESSEPQMSSFDAHLAEYYENEDFSTIVSFIAYKSAFGKISVTSALGIRFPLKVIPKEWNETAKDILFACIKGERAPVLMLHGPKGSGKSTAAIYIINYLLNYLGSVALLDTDIGQPISSAPGLLTLTLFEESITVPPHTLINEIKPKMSCLLGDVKVTNLFLILRHVHSCFKFYEKLVDSDFTIPLIINTFGWTDGIGGHLLECICAITHVSMILKLENGKHIDLEGGFENHEHIERILKDVLEIEHVEEVHPDLPLDTTPMYADLVNEMGGSLPWKGDNCRIMNGPSYTHITGAIGELMERFIKSEFCDFKTWSCLAPRKPFECNAFDLRWLRMSSYLNPAFGDAIHFPQLQHEEFFGSLETFNFKTHIKSSKMFVPPKQLILRNDLSFVVMTRDYAIRDIQELCPVISGSIVALCSGRCDTVFSNKIYWKWKFITFAYAHYLDASLGEVLISYPAFQDERELKSAKIIVIW